MNIQNKQRICASMRNFRLPRYNDLPDTGLYLEQAAQYVSECLTPICDAAVTGSMISNYVKKGLLANPVKKQYFRDHLAYLIFISAAKSVLSMENLGLLMRLQRQTYSNQQAYDYFCAELENVAHYVFGAKQHVESIGQENTDEKMLLRDTIIALAHRAYLNRCFEYLHTEEEQA